MPDPGFVSGFIGVVVDKAIQEILDRIDIAVRCRKELASLKDLVMKIEPIVKQIQRYRQPINKKRKDKVSAVSGWLKHLNALLQEASEMARRCTIPTCNVVLRYQTSMKISGLILHINEHLKLSPLVELAQLPELLEEQTQKLQQNLGQIKEAIETLASSSTSPGGLSPTGYAEMKLIDEPFTVGQQEGFSVLENLVIEDAEAKNIGVLGKGGSGKTLILKKLFNSEKVRNYFSDGLLLWLTVSQSPSLKSLRNELRAQIALQKGADSGQNLDEDGVKLLLNQKLQQSQSFAIFLDDVWGEHASELLENLGVQRPVREHSKCKIIVSSRDRSALLKMGIADKYAITMEDLIEEDSWKLFAFHAFPYNKGILPANIDEDIAKSMCRKCGGLPIAVKVVGRAMGGSTLPRQWEWALNSLLNTDSVYDCLRLSYDALGNEDVNMQLCFLYIATCCFKGGVLDLETALFFWVGEGLLAGKVLHQLSCDPFEMGKIYVNILADRCLIEPIMRNFEGQVVIFRIHDVLLDLATRVAEEEENFYCRVGRDLTALNEHEISERTWTVFMSGNKLTSLSESFRAPQVRSLVMMFNKDFTVIPKRVMGSMVSLKVLNLRRTSLKSLPDSVGCLKQLVWMDLSYTPIKTLPQSFTNLVNLEILSLNGSSITELPYGLHKLASLKFLDLMYCKDLQYVPCSISNMTSLQSLQMMYCDSLWTKQVGYGRKKVACIDNIASLKQLKKLRLQNNGKIISEGTLGSMIEMEILSLALTEMENLPGDLSKMSKLRRLSLQCSHLVKMGSSFCDLQNLRYLQLSGCYKLEELPHLHTLRSLRNLAIYDCPMLRQLPKEFGCRGAFPSLEIFSIAFLPELEELPVVEVEAMPLLQVLSIMVCPSLKILSESYLQLKTLKTIKIYSDSILIKNLNHYNENKIKVATKPEHNILKVLETLLIIAGSRNTSSIMTESGDNFVITSYSTETWGNQDFLSYTSPLVDID